jgi:hypothetical protein
MSDTRESTTTVRRRPQIKIENDVLEPRHDLAAYLGVVPRTVQRMGLPTTYIGNVAYHPHNGSLAIIAARVRHPKGRQR